jgi:hypothetical protein
VWLGPQGPESPREYGTQQTNRRTISRRVSHLRATGSREALTFP